MSTAGGPRLAGIGRVADSTLVLAMDAHDAGSYPGEPTTNLIPYYSSRNPALVASVFTREAQWTSAADSTEVSAPDGSSTTTKAVSGTTGGQYFYRYIDANMGVTLASSTTYTLSVWAKTTSTDSTTALLSFQDRANGQYGGTVKTITTEWQRFYFTITTGATTPANTLIGWNAPTTSRTFYFWGWQVEQKGYATPYVASQLLDPSAQGPSARPTSTNLMVSGKFAPSGGTITTSGGWTTHVFTSSGTFTPGCNCEAEVLVVAGGGGGGTHSGGGGGAGGLLYYGSETPKTPNGGALAVASGTAYTITVGGGGAGGFAQTTWVSPYTNNVGTNGVNSSMAGGAISLTAIGGGGGSSPGGGLAALGGGCGGGGGRTLAGGAGTAGQGYAGSNGWNYGGTNTPNYPGAGGGGAGATGTTGGANDGGNGGVGLVYSISGSAVYYAGGGGGNIQGGSGSGGAGGNGGGGTGSTWTGYGFNGTDNTGGGGGGTQYYATPVTGRYGNGGSGIVIIRYRTFQDSSPSKHTVTAIGDVAPSTTKSKFSGGSIYFDGAGDKLSVADSADWHFGSGDFTVDMWINGSTFTNVSYPALFSQYIDDNNFLALYFAPGNMYLWGRNAGAAYSTLSLTDAWSTNTWYHVALVRNGTSTLFFRDGVLLASVTESWTVSDLAAPFYVGWWGYGGVDYSFNGYIDEFRVTKGTALWTSAFTPPTRRNRNAPVVDLSGSDNGGNFNTKDMTDVATYRDGQVIEPVASAVWDFDGTDDVIDLGNINYSGLTGLTVATWVYSSGFGANDSFLSSWGDNAYSNYGWLLFASQWVGSKIDWLVSSNGTSYTRCAGTLGLTNNLWYHIVGTWNSSGAMVLYINGALDGTATGPTSIMNNDFNTFIGCDSDGGSEAKVRFFGGQMGNATIWKTTLTAAQVKQNFNTQRSRFKV